MAELDDSGEVVFNTIDRESGSVPGPESGRNSPMSQASAVNSPTHVSEKDDNMCLVKTLQLQFARAI